MTRDPELALLEPNTEIMQCSVCAEVIWKHKTDPITTRISIPSRSDPETINQAFGILRMSADEFHREMLQRAEAAARKHMSERHRFRLWLWDRYGWDRVLRRWFR